MHLILETTDRHVLHFPRTVQSIAFIASGISLESAFLGRSREREAKPREDWCFKYQLHMLANSLAGQTRERVNWELCYQKFSAKLGRVYNQLDHVSPEHMALLMETDSSH